ncbi:MAG TPA: hypothetical protein VH640_24565 [Bryobacteraceae bacterium]|jgi:hypothetical protein
MHRSARFSGAISKRASWGLALVPALLLGQNISREGNRWVMTLGGSLAAGTRLQVTSQGPIHVEGGSGSEVTFTAKLSVEARTEDDARRIFSRYHLRTLSANDQVIVAAPGGPVLTNLNIKAPRLKLAVVQTSGGSVEANSIDGDLRVNSGGGDLKCDRIGGDCNLATAGGRIQVGEVGGDLECATAGGAISVKTVRGDAVLETAGGSVDVSTAGGDLRVSTAGGAIHIGSASGNVTAGSGGGSITVGKAGGQVTVREMAGPVEVGAAAAVRCESGSGGVRVSNISGPMRITTALGSIIASLMDGRFRESMLETGNGDVTVLIPSNLGVTIRAETERGRVVSDFPMAQRLVGMEVRAEGSINGGGPMLRIAGAGGTIFIKRQ